jgi:sugar lactone lactonase YvrE
VCSLDSNHTILALSLSAGTNTTSVVAGNWSKGMNSAQLETPNGMFVDTSLNLYVADCGNNRIQFFKNKQLNGTTVVGITAPGTISLNLPTAITLDGNGYYFIVDLGNHRVVGSGPTGFRCIVACSGQSGSLSSQLNAPRSLAFDTDGNLFVADNDNFRIQKFLLASNSCSKSKHRRRQAIDAWNINICRVIKFCLI